MSATRTADRVRAVQRTVLTRLGGRTMDPALTLPELEVAGDTVTLPYHLEGLATLRETVRFPGHDLEAAAATSPATAGALRLLHLTASTSYYKTVLPRRVETGPLPSVAVRLLEALLTHGLAEFAAHHDLNLTDWPQIVAAPGAPRPPAPRPDRVLVPIGGGKDSAVTALLVRRAGLDAVGFAVNPRPSMQRTAAATGLELLTAERRLDPRLLELNDAGALNGHVPITAIVASIAQVAATLTGRGDVLLANEASADEPTRIIDGRAVNHQYSKSGAYQALHLAATDALTGGATRMLSLLRPLPELAVAGAFAHLGAPLTAVNSCNRAYALTRERREWCGRCPKCLFVQVMLASFTTPEAFRAGTGFDALADPALVARVADLTDPQRKPYECVGTVAEVALALDRLAEDPAWADHAAVRALGHADRGARVRTRQLLDAIDPGLLPEPYAAMVAGLVAELRAAT